MCAAKIEVPNICPDTLLFVLDDTGHETLAGDHTFYGMGGIALRSSRNEEQLWPAWKMLRTLVNGDPDKPLHAFEFGQQARYRPELHEAMNAFFRDHHFNRIAVTATAKTIYPNHLTLMQSVILMLKKHLTEIATLSVCPSIAVVVESSQRANDSLMKHFGILEVDRNGIAIPVEHCLMEKKYKEPALEVADFVANAAGSMARWRLRGKQGFPKDFAAVFQSVPRVYTHYMDISEVTGVVDGELVLAHELR